MKSRDLLKELYERKITASEAQDIVDRAVASPDVAEIEKLLTLGHIEWTAYGHGALLSAIARWRYEGWPKTCARCGREIAPEKFGWRVVRKRDGQRLQHLECPATTIVSGSR